MDKDSDIKSEKKDIKKKLPEHNWPEKLINAPDSGSDFGWPENTVDSSYQPGVLPTTANYVGNEQIYGAQGILKARFMSYANSLNPVFIFNTSITTDFGSAVRNYFKDLEPIHQYFNGNDETAIYYIKEVYVMVDRPTYLYRSSDQSFRIGVSLVGTSQQAVEDLAEEIEKAFPS